jgi:alpha-methylacyl-CoA racemase
VLTFEEAPDHPQLAARQTLRRVAGGIESAPAPRFSRSAAGTAATTDADLDDVLRDWTIAGAPGRTAES